MDRQLSTSTNDLECMLLDENTEPKALPLSLLEYITRGFSHGQEIGRGGFAVVYKGTLDNGLTVAVKKMFFTLKLEKEFEGEVECLLKVKHTNIVRFLGYCADTQGSAAQLDSGKVVIADVRERMLCFEYLPNGSLQQHIHAASGGLEWSERYKIIKQICEGLRYLHRKKIIHLDLKPANILMDANMVPKIADFGLSKCFDEEQTRLNATSIGGTLGYLAPEFAGGVITDKFDLYSLGVIIIELLTGKKGHQDVEIVLESWSYRLDKSQGNTSFEQIRVCTEIGLECTEFNPNNRPASIEHIIARLDETVNTQMAPGSSELLEVDPLVLRFPFQPNMPIWRSMQLTNKSDEHVSFRLTNKIEKQQCFARLPLKGVVPPRSTYTLVVTMEKQEKLPEKRYIDMILESCALGENHNKPYKRFEIYDTEDEVLNGEFYEAEEVWNDELYEMKELRNDELNETEEVQGDELYETEDMRNDEARRTVMHEVTLKAICTLQQGIISSEILHVEIPYRHLRSFDIHPTKQWIITGEDGGRIRIWSYETQRLVASFKVSTKTVHCIYFIERKNWFVAGTDGFIHVYSYANMEKITSFRANTDNEAVISLAVHPTQPYLLSLSASCDQVKLWDWNKGQECIQTFTMECSTRSQFVFNPKDTIALALVDHTVKIWTLQSPESKFSLSGHSDKVNCLDFFTHDDQEYLITGSDDCTAKIWDMQKNTCVHTHEAFSQVISVCAPPDLPLIITGSCNGTVHLWSSEKLRVERVLQISFTAATCRRLACLIGPKRVIIGHDDGLISVVDIDDASYQQQTTATDSGYSEPLSSSDSKSGDTTYNVTQPISGGLIYVHPPGLRFCFEPKKTISCSLQLTNKIDQHVAFRLMGKSGILPPKSTYTLVVVTQVGEIVPQEYDVIMWSSISGDRYMVSFKDQAECDEFFEEAKMVGNVVHVVTLKATFALLGELPSEAIPPITKIIPSVLYAGTLCSLDAHPMDPLILTGHDKGRFLSEVHMWNYGHTPAKRLHTVCGAPAISLVFIPHKKWFAVGSLDGFIRVYSYENGIEIITRFEAHDASIRSLFVHPTKSYITSYSNDMIKLWGWNETRWMNFTKECKDWHCTYTFEAEHSFLVKLVAFNQNDSDIFVVASDGHIIKVWNLDSPICKYTLSGHSGKVNCYELFKRVDQHCLITGSDDCTAKIWDLEKRTCIQTLESFMSPVISVISLPGRPYIISGSKDGIIYIWSSADFRLLRMVSFGRTGVVRRLNLTETRRIVVEQRGTVSFIDIGDEEALH